MLDLKDLMETKFSAQIEHLDTKHHSLSFHCKFEDYEMICTPNTRQLHCLIDNLQHISTVLKKYLADKKSD
jgi:hypothetical protein